MACNMPEPCKFPSLDSCKKRFLWTHKEVELAPHLVIGLVFKVGDGDRFPLALHLENLDPFLRVSKQGPCLAAIVENGGDRRFVQLEIARLFTLKDEHKETGHTCV